MFNEINISTIWDDFLEGLTTGVGLFNDIKNQEQQNENKKVFVSSFSQVLPLIIIGAVIVVIFMVKK